MQAAGFQRPLPGCRSAVTCTDGGTLRQHLHTHRRLTLNGKSLLRGGGSLPCEAMSIVPRKQGQRRWQPARMQSQQEGTTSTVQIRESNSNEERPLRSEAVVDWRQMVVGRQQPAAPVDPPSSPRSPETEPETRRLNGVEGGLKLDASAYNYREDWRNRVERQSDERRSVGSQSVRLRSVGSQPVGSQSVRLRSVGSQPVGSQSVGLLSGGRQSDQRQLDDRRSVGPQLTKSQSVESQSAERQSKASNSFESQSTESPRNERQSNAASTSGRTQTSERETMAVYKDWVQGASRDSVWKDGTVRLGDQLVRIRKGQVSIVAPPSAKILALAAAAAPATQHSVKARAQRQQAATARMQERAREYEKSAARVAQKDARGRNSLKAYLHLLLACYDRLTLPQEQRFSRRVLAHQALQTVRAQLEVRLERPPTDAEWARAADIGSIEELHQRVERGITAKCRLVEGNLRLAVSIANKFRGMGLDFEDLVQAGIMGLIKGVDRYDVRKGFRFSTYTTYWIRQSIQATLRRDSRLVRLPAYAWAYLSRISRARGLLRSRLGRPANLEETAAAVDLPARTVRRLLAASREVLSLEGGGATSILGDGERFESWADKLIDPNCDKDPYETLAQEGAPNDIERILSRLEEEEARVLELRLGLRGQAVHTLVQTSQLTSIPFGRIAPIQKKAIAKLRGPYKKEVEDLLTV